jgi:hypothetical protein
MAMSGVTVLYGRIPQMIQVGGHFQLAPGETRISGSATSDSSGAFSIASLPIGQYEVCADTPGLAYLDPCKWSSSPSINVVQAQTNQANIQLQEGVFLRVHVNDAAGLLPSSPESPAGPAHLIIGVIVGSGGFWAASVTGSTGTSREYMLKIPTNVPLKLWIFSQYVTLTNGVGASVDNSGANIPFVATPGNDQLFVLNVSGTLPEPVGD